MSISPFSFIHNVYMINKYSSQTIIVLNVPTITSKLIGTAFCINLSLYARQTEGNLLKIKTLIELSLVASRRSFLCDPSVLFPFSSSLVKKWGSNFSAQRCRSRSFSNVPWILSTFRGVTQLRISSSLTGVDTASVTLVFTVWHAGVSGADGNRGKDGKVFDAMSALRPAKASTSIVDRSFGKSTS